MAQTTSTPRATRPWPVLSSLQGYRRAWLRPDLLAGLTLAAIAIPEQMATSTLAGFPVQFGLYVFIAAGLAVALFASSRQLSAGADAVITGTFAAQLSVYAAFGSPEYLELVVLLALVVGVLLIIVGLLRFGWLADFLSTPVTTGFLAGVGVTIIVGQLPRIFGVEKGDGGPVEQVGHIISELGEANWWSVAIAAGALVLVMGLERVSPKIPGALLALIGSIVVVAAFDLDDRGVDVLGEVPAGLPGLSVPEISLERLSDVFLPAVTIAFICLIQVAAVSRSFGDSDSRKPVDVNRDFVAVGAGSFGSAFVGGFPINASPPRTAIVARSGGRSQLATLTSVVIVVVVALFATSLLEELPEATLGAILAYVGTRIMRFSELRAIGRYDKREATLAIITLVGVAVIGVGPGVVIAVLLAIVEHTWRASRAHTIAKGRVDTGPIWLPERSELPAGVTLTEVPGVAVVALEGPLFFANAEPFRSVVRELTDHSSPPLKVVILDAEAVYDVDYTGAVALRAVESDLTRRGIKFGISRAAHRFTAEHLGLSTTRLFETNDDAIQALAD